MARSLDEIFGNKSQGTRTLDQIFAPPAPVQKPAFAIPLSQLRSSHASTIEPKAEPSYKTAFIKGTLGSLVGRALTPLVEKATGRDVDLSTLPEPETLGQKALSFGSGMITDLPAWLAGDLALARPLAALAKTAPIAKAASFAPKITPALGTGVRAGSTYALPVNAAESVLNRDGVEGFADRLKEAPLMALGGTVLHGGGQLLGKGIKEGSSVFRNTLKPLGVPPAPLNPPRSYSVQRRTGLGPLKNNDIPLQSGSDLMSSARKVNPVELQSNPLADVRSAYEPITLQDVRQVNPVNRSVQRGADLGKLKVSDRLTPEYKARQAELSSTFKDLPIGSVDTPLATRTLQEGIDRSMGIGKPTEGYDGLDAFGKPIQTFKKSTDTQDAIAEVTAKMTIQANDVTKMIKQAYNQTKIATTRSQIQKMGGISPSKGDLFEEQQVIPAWIKNSKGRPLDEVADTLGMTSEELRAIISSEEFKPKDFVAETFKVLRNDKDYQANSKLLETLKAQLPGKRTLGSLKNKYVELKPVKDVVEAEPAMESTPMANDIQDVYSQINKIKDRHKPTWEMSREEFDAYNKELSRIDVPIKLLELENDVDLPTAQEYADMLNSSEMPGISVYRSGVTKSMLDYPFSIGENGKSLNPWTRDDLGKEIFIIGDGNHRAAAAQLAGKEKVPVDFGEKLSYEDMISNALRDGKTIPNPASSVPAVKPLTKSDIKLKPRELTPKPEPLPIQPQRVTLSGSLPPVNAPLARPVKKLTPVKREPLQWTNRDGVVPTPKPVRPIPAEQTLDDVLRGRGEQPVLQGTSVGEPIRTSLEIPRVGDSAQVGVGKGKITAPRKIINEDVFWHKVKSESKWQGDIASLQEGIKSGKVNIDELPAEMAKEVRLKMNLQMFATPSDVSLPEPQSKIIIGKSKEKVNFKNALDKFYTAIVNTQQPIVNAGKLAESNIGKLASNTKNVSGIVDNNLLTALVDKQGNKVGESFKSTVDSIPKGKEEEFWTYMSQRHNIDRARQESRNVPKVDKQGFLVKDKDGNQLYDTVIDKKPTPVQANYTSKMSKDAVRIAERDNPEYKAIGDGIVKWLDSFMTTWGVDTGIVNKDIYKGLRETYKSYFPTQREFSELEKSISDNVSQKFASQRTPIRKATGSERDIRDPIENIMNLVDRTIRTAKYNEVGQSLLNSVRVAPEKLKPLAEVIPTKDGMFSNLDNIITVLEDGKPVYLKINDKMLLDSMNGLPKSIGSIPVLSTITNGFKQLITQSNPIFSVRNIFRDIPTAYVYGSESNPLKFGAGLIGAAKDIVTNSPRLQKYKAVGGGGANFFSAGDITKSAAELTGKINPIKKVISAPIKAIQKFNNMTETAPRLAEFNRVLKKTDSVTDALYAANDVTVNFSRGGNITKNVDKVVPYLNAGVAGLDRFFRGFKDPKTAIQTVIKSGVAITTPTLALYLVNKDNPNYEALDNRTKDNYYLIPKEDGTFIKLPKSRELGVLFSSLLERGLRAKDGKSNSFKGFGNTVATNFSPANPIDSNFFAPALEIIGKGDNKDFANRPIIPQSMLMDKRSDYLQYDEKSTEIAKAIGEMTKGMPGNEDGVSPKQLDYFVKSYSGVIGQFGMPLLTSGGSPKKALTSQFSADPTFSNQTTTDFYDKLDKLSAKAVDKNITEKIPSKKLTPEEDMKNSMNGVSLALSKGTKQINTLLASNDPRKDEKIKVIKTRILELSRKSILADTPKLMQRVEVEAKKIFK